MKASGTVKDFLPISGGGWGLHGDISWAPGVEQLITTHKMFRFSMKNLEL